MSFAPLSSPLAGIWPSSSHLDILAPRSWLARLSTRGRASRVARSQAEPGNEETRVETGVSTRAAGSFATDCHSGLLSQAAGRHGPFAPFGEQARAVRGFLGKEMHARP